MKKIGKIFAGMFAILFCGGLSTFFSHDFSFLNTPKTAEISGETRRGGGGAEPIIDPKRGTSPQNEIILPTDANLPQGYVQLEFIQSSGDQYIDTGIVCDSTSLTGEIDFQFTTTQNDRWVIGSVASMKGIEAGIYQNKFYKDLGCSYTQNDLLARTTTTFSVANGHTNNLNIYLFTKNWNGQTNNSGNVKIYSAKFYDGGTLFKNFVPCYKEDTKELGMYETEEGKFYGNNGSGEFLGVYAESGNYIIKRGYDDYYLDYEIPASLQGEGNAQHPYQINSLEDFLLFTKKNYPRDTYFELNQNIKLNDETFDKNGNAFGGDGIVYSWTAIFGGSTINFDGKGHTVSGMYFNNSKLWWVFLFGEKTFQTLKNLNVEDFYVVQGSGAVVGREAMVLTNVHTRNGYSQGCRGLMNAGNLVTNCTNSTEVHGQNGMIGVLRPEGKMENCINYGDVYGGSAGFTSIQYNEGYGTRTFINCKNYGNVTGNMHIAGILQGTYSNVNTITTFINCENFGTITNTSHTTGGIMSHCTGGKVSFINCGNHGFINANWMVGGITHNVNNNAVFLNCVNDNISNNDNNTSYLVSSLGDNCIIENCTVKGTTGYLVYLPGSNLIVRNCKVDFSDYPGSGRGVFTYENLLAQDAIFENIEINLRSKQSSVYALRLFGGIELRRNATVKNIKITTNFNFNTSNLSATYLQGCVLQTPTQKWYYGVDFSGFFTSWRTGEIGLASMSSLSAFCSRLDENALRQMGYTKKEV